MKRCVYCKAELTDGRDIDVCDKCGFKVWGEKMFNTIVQNMKNARENGDLCHMNQVDDLPKNINDFRMLERV